MLRSGFKGRFCLARSGISLGIFLENSLPWQFPGYCFLSLPTSFLFPFPFLVFAHWCRDHKLIMYQRRTTHQRSGHMTIRHGISTEQKKKLLKWMQNQRLAPKYLRVKYLHSFLTKVRLPLLLLPPFVCSSLLPSSPFLSPSSSPYLLFLQSTLPLFLPPLIFISTAFPPFLISHFYLSNSRTEHVCSWKRKGVCEGKGERKWGV